MKKDYDTQSIDKERGKRLCELRKNAHLTLDQLAVEIDKIQVKQQGNTYSDPGYSKRAGICNIEHGAGLSRKKANAYSEFFNVSLDYLYYGIESYKPEYDEIKKIFGLTDEALHNLESLNRNNINLVTVLNTLLSSKLFPLFKELLSHYSEHANIDAIKHLVHYPNMVRLDNMPTSQLILRYINLDSKTFVRLSKEEISDTAKRIADEIQKRGGKQ